MLKICTQSCSPHKKFMPRRAYNKTKKENEKKKTKTETETETEMRLYLVSYCSNGSRRLEFTGN